MALAAAIQELHDRCAIYTSAPTAARLLDLCGWTAEADLTQSILLEPCIGEGAILLEGVRRLLASFRACGQSPTLRRLSHRIIGFEFHRATAASAKRALRLLLLQEGLAWGTVNGLVETWIVEADFLLQPPLKATHVASNPPYVRWTKLPENLARAYRETLPPVATRGDLSVAFLHRMQEWAQVRDGTIATLVSDRWMYAQYGEGFIRDSQERGWRIAVVDDRPEDPFVRSVGAYSAIVLLSRRPHASVTGDVTRASARALHATLVGQHGTLGDAACHVRVGPALGAGRTFLVEPGDCSPVEPELVRPFVAKSDFGNGEIAPSGRRVILPYDRHGKLIDPKHWPQFADWARAREKVLRGRSQFRNCGRHWRTIDAVPPIWSRTPKLLVPELCKVPIATIDRAASIPAHSIYAIWSDEWPIEDLARVLNAGLLELTARAEAPTLKLGWIRFYKRFLIRTPLPRWSTVATSTRRDLASSDDRFDEAFLSLFGFRPGALPL